MKLRLNRDLLRWVMVSCLTAAMFSVSAQAIDLLAEDIDLDNQIASPRFYDTGKGSYLEWNIEYNFPDLYTLYNQHGNFSFLGDLYERIPESATSTSECFKDNARLVDDSDTCWAQVSMNLVEYWHSYYGVFCEDSRELPFGYTYDPQYLTAMGGTLSLKQNLLFIDTFVNEGDCLESYLEWFFKGDDTPYYSQVEVKGKGGFWKNYFSGNVRQGADVSNLTQLKTNILKCLGYTRTSNGYVLTEKGKLVYLSLNGHALTCHGVELSDTGSITSLYVSNSDDIEYGIFKLYPDSSLVLYTDPEHTEKWEYAGYINWAICQVLSIQTPGTLKNMLAEYDAKYNPLIWTGKSGKWETHPTSCIREALPDETTGWQVAVGEKQYPIYYLDETRIALFDDSANSGKVKVDGVVATIELRLNNQSMDYSFTGGEDSKIEAAEIVAKQKGKSVFQSVSVSGDSVSLENYTIELGKGASFDFNSGVISSEAAMRLHGGSADFNYLLFESDSQLEIASESSLKVFSLCATEGVTFLFTDESAVLTFNGTIESDAPIMLRYTPELEVNEKRPLITFAQGLSDWNTTFTTSDEGILSYVDNVLYYTYIPIRLSWNSGDGSWSASQWRGQSQVTNEALCQFGGSSSYRVSLTGSVTPCCVEVSNTGGQITFEGKGNITGKAQIIKSNDGTLIINTANSYSGGTDITGGTLLIGNAKSLGTGAVTLQNASLNMAGYAIDNDVCVSGVSTILNGDGYSGKLTVKSGNLNGTVNLAQTAFLCGGEIAASLSGTAGVTISGDVTLSGKNTYSGSTTLVSAHLKTKHFEALGSSGVFSSGNSSIEVDAGTSLLLKKSIINDGTLTLQGLYQVSGIQKTSFAPVRIDANGKQSQSGFLFSGGYTMQIVNGGTTLSDSATIIHNGHKLSLDKNGLATYAGEMDYSSYLISTGTTVGVKAINSASTEGGETMCEINLDGGTLTLDDNISGAFNLHRGTLVFDNKNKEIQVNGTLTLNPGVWVDFVSGPTQLGTYTFVVSDGNIEVNGTLDECFGIRNLAPRQQYGVRIDGNSVVIEIEAAPLDLVWVGGKNKVWQNDGDGWLAEASFKTGDYVSFANGTVEIVGEVQPGAITLTPDKSITFKTKFDKKTGKWSGSIGGDSVYVTIAGGAKGKVTMNDGNTYNGITSIESGTVSVGGADSFGRSSIVVSGGTLDLKSKEVANDITLSGAAAIKGGAKYTGEFTMTGGVLQKGSVINVADTATLEAGTMDGTLSGTGMVQVTGAVTLGNAAKVTTTQGLTVADSGALTIGAKGLALNAKTSTLTIDGGSLASAGKLSGYALSMSDGATLTVSNAKPMAVNFKGGVSASGIIDKSGMVTKFAEIGIYGAFTATELDLTGSKFTLEMNPDLVDAKNQPKAQSITINGKGTDSCLDASEMEVAGKMSVTGNLKLKNNSSLKLYDPGEKNAAMPLAVKGNLTVGSGSRLTLSGALSAANLTLDGGSINLTGTKPQTIKVSNQLAINSGTDINFNFNVTAKDANKKAFKILTFKTIGEYVNGDFVAWTDADKPTPDSLLELLGLQDAGCTLTLDVKKKNISLTVNDLGAWEAAMEDGEDDAASEATPAPVALAALPVAPDFSPVADALVQANWGQVEASRAFVNAIGSRSMAVQLGSGERAVWASATGSSSRHSAAGGHNGSDTNVTGGALGVETQLGESSLLGVALGSSRTRVSAHNYGTIKQDTTHLGLYGQTGWSKLSADWSAAYGRSDSEIHGSSWKQNHLQLDGRVSYNHALSSSTVLRGFGGMQYYASDSATVDGIKTGSIQNLRAEIGVGASHAIDKLVVYGEVAVQQDIVRHNPKVSMEGLRFGGMNPGRTGLNFTVGASYELNDKWSVNASYTGEIVENANAHSANIGVSYKF